MRKEPAARGKLARAGERFRRRDRAEAHDSIGDEGLASTNVGADEWFSRKPIVNAPDFLKRR